MSSSYDSESTLDGQTYFVSYDAATNGELAEKLGKYFESRNSSCIRYKDQRYFPEGCDFVEEISDALWDADQALCLLSVAYLASSWCIKEYIVSQTMGKGIIVVTEDCDALNLGLVPENFIDTRGMSVEEAFAEIIKNLPDVSSNKKQQSPSREEIKNYIEQVVIYVPRFTNDDAGEYWQHMCLEYLRTQFDGQNVVVEEHPAIVSNKEEATHLLKQNNTDIMLYGSLRMGKLKINYITSRGWELPSDHTTLGFSKSFMFTIPYEKGRDTGFSQVSYILKIALGSLENVRNRSDEANMLFAEAFGSVSSGELKQMGAQYLLQYQSMKQYLLRNFPEVLEYCDAAIKIDPEFILAHIGKGLALLGLKDFIGVIQSCTFALKIREDFELYKNRGMAFVQLKRHQDGLADFDRAIEIEPGLNNIISYAEKAKELIRLAKYQETLETFEKAMKIWCPGCRDSKTIDAFIDDFKIKHDQYSNRDLAWLFECKGVSLARLGKSAEAVEDYSRAIKIAPNYPDFFLNRSVAYANSKKWCEALEDYNHYIELGRRPDLDEELAGFAERLEQECRTSQDLK